jgi:DNA-binding transcriptional MerR regulator
MKPLQLAAKLEVSTSAVRAWSVEFAQYLSPTGAGGNGRHRDFNQHDINVLAHIKALKALGRSAPEVHHELKSLMENDWIGLPAFQDTISNMMNVPGVPIVAADMAIDEAKKALLREIVMLNERLEKAEQQISAEREKNEAFLREIANLRAQLSEAQTIAKLYETGRLKPPTSTE